VELTALLRPASWNKGGLLLREGEGEEWRERKETGREVGEGKGGRGER